MADKYITIGSDGTRKLLHDNADADSTYSDTVHIQSAAAVLDLDLAMESDDFGVYADDADFTAATTNCSPVAGAYQSSPTAVTDGDLGIVGITSTRELKVADDDLAATIYTDGAGTPSKGVLVMGSDATNPQAILTDSDGHLQVDVLSSALPTGAATEATLATIDADTSALAGCVSGTEVQTDVLTLPTQAYGDTAAITRPADTTAYAAGDVIGAATDATAAIDFGIGNGSGEFLITSASLRVDAAAVPAGMANFRLHLYNITPPSALADNAAWDLPAGDRDAYLGFIDLGTPVDLGSTLYVKQDAINMQLTLASANVYAYLVTTGAFTPTSAAVKTVTLHSVRL
jgi:hypothetical protein